MTWPFRDGRPPAGMTRVVVSLETFEDGRLVIRTHSFEVPVGSLAYRLRLAADGAMLVDLPFYTDAGADECEDAG